MASREILTVTAAITNIAIPCLGSHFSSPFLSHSFPPSLEDLSEIQAHVLMNSPLAMPLRLISEHSGSWNNI